MKRHILFVDDEPNVLISIKRMLHGMRKDWDMQFAENGPEALTILETQLGPEHPNLAACTNTLALLYMAAGRDRPFVLPTQAG